jgi:hypothetical protein
MLEYIQFYTKNLSNFTVLLLIGAVIAILDITLRNVVKGVYLNVRENMRQRHGGGREGLANKDKGEGKGEGKGKGGAKGEASATDDAAEPEPTDESCPKDCNAVEALRKKLTGLIENAAKLQKEMKENSETIKGQHKTIENMQKSIQILMEKKK